MSEEVKPKDNVVEVRSTTDVLDATGGVINRDASPLAGIFDKIESGKSEGLSAEQSLTKSAPAPSKKDEPLDTSEEIETPPAKEVKTKEEPTSLDKSLEEALSKKNENQEVSRQKLLEEADKKAESKTKAEPVKEEKPAATTEEVAEEELQVLPHDKPKTAKRIQALLKKIESINSEVVKTKTEAQEKAARLTEMEKKLTEVKTVDPKTEEAVKKQLDELSMYRRRYGLENDPEIKKKFDDRIASAENDIPDILKKNGASEGILGLIKEEGGWQKFSRSGRSIKLNDGSVVTGAEFADLIVNQLPFSDRTKVQAATMEQIQLQREKERFFKEEQDKASDFFKKIEEDAKKQAELQSGQIKETEQKVKKWLDETTSKNDWLKEREIPATATPEQKQEIEEDNRYTKQLNALLKKNLSIQTVEESLDVVLDATRFYQERREKSRLLAENAKLKSELEAKAGEIAKIKGSSKSIPKSGSISGGGAAAIATASKQPQHRTLEDAFDAIERGEDLSGKE